VAACLVGAIPCKAQTDVWNSAVSGNWATTTDWSLGVVPVSTQPTTINAVGSAYTVTLSTTYGYTSTLFLDSANATLLLNGQYLELYATGGTSNLTLGTVQLNGNAGIYYVGGSGGHTLTNAGTIQSIGGSNYIYSNGGVGNGLSFSNAGTVSVTGGTLYLGNGGHDSVSNSGTITANGGTIILNGGTTSIANTGTLTATGGGTISIGGTFTSADLGGTINGAGGTLNLVGTLANSGTLAPPADHASGGIFTLDGGTIIGGTVGGTNGSLTFSSGGGTLNNVAMSGAFNVPANASFTVENGTSFNGSVTLGGNNTIDVTGTTPAVLTVASGLTWTDSGALSIYAYANGLTVSNQGTMNLQGGTFGGNGTTGFVVNNSGSLTNTNAGLTIGNYTGDAMTNTGSVQDVSSGYYASMNIGGGANTTVTNTSPGLIETSQTGSIGYSSTLSVGDGSGALVNNSGTIEAIVTGSGYANASVGNGSGTTVHNTGTLLATGANAGLYLGYDGTSYSSAWTNIGGTITAASAGTVYLGGSFTNANLTQGTINGAGGTLDLVGTLTNTGTLAAPDGGGGAIFTLYGGTIVGGTVDGSNGALSFSNSGGLLSGVAFINKVTVPANAYFTIGMNGPTATSFGGNLSLGGSNTVYLAQPLTIGSSQTWSDTTSLNLLAQTAGVTLTNQGAIALSGGTIAGQGYTGFIFNNSGTLTNTNGSLTIDNYGGDTMTNTGSVLDVSSGYYASMNIAGGSGSVITNTAPGLIETSQSGSIGYSSTMDVGDGTGATVNNSGTIEAIVSGSGYATANVGNGSGTTVHNTGTLLATGTNAGLYLGYDGTSYSSAWTNTGGTITAASGGTVYLGGSFTNANLAQGTINGTGGTLDLVGTLTDTGTLAAPDGGGAIFTLYGGTIVGGTVDGSNGALTFSSSGGLLSGVTFINTVSVPMNGVFTLGMNGPTATTFGGNVSLGGSNSVYLQQPVTIGPGQTWSDTGTLAFYGQASGITLANQGAIAVSGGAISGQSYSGFIFNNSGTLTNTNGGFTIANYGGDTMTNTGSVLDVSSGYYASMNIGSGSGNVINNTAPGLIETSQSGSIGYSSTLSVGDGSGTTLNNSGTVEAIVTGSGYATANVGNGSGTIVHNTGTLLATGANAALYLGNANTYYSSAWTNIGGTITAASGGTVYLGGSFTNANLTQGTINGAGGILDIVGTLADTGTLAAPDGGGGGIFTLYGGTIVGGTVDGSNGALTFSNSGGLLSGVTFINNVSVPMSGVFTLGMNGPTATSFGGNVSFGGNNTVYLAQPLTIGSGQTWSDTGSLNLFAQVANVTLSNQGSIALGGGTIAGQGYTGFIFNNSGTLTNTNGGLNIDDYNGDAMTNTGSLLDVSSGYYASMNIGSGSGSVITNTAPGLIETSQTGSIGYSSTLDLGDGSGTTVNNSGTIEAIVTGSGYATANVGNGSATTVNNTGTLLATGANAALYLGYDGTYYSSAWTNIGGTITAASGGIVYLGGSFTSTNLTQGTINGTGGTLDLVGTLTVSGTLAAPNGGGIFTLDGGAIAGGTVNGASNALTFGGGGSLSGVSLTGNFSVPASAYFSVSNGTTFSSGTMTFSGSNDVYLGGPTGFTLGSGATWNAASTLGILGQTSSETFLNQGSISASGGEIYGQGYANFFINNLGSIVNNGYSTFFVGQYANDKVTNSGTIEQNGGGGTYVTYGEGPLTNLASNTLTGGSWIAAGGGSMYIYQPMAIDTIGPGTIVAMSGAGSGIYTFTGTGPSFQPIEQTLTTNNGVLEVLGGRNYSSTNALTNNGTIQLGGGVLTAPSLTEGPGSTLSGYGTFTPALSGIVIGNGVTVAPNSAVANSFVGTVTFNVPSSSVTLAPGGVYLFDVSNAGGAAGVGYDTIAVTGAGAQAIVTATSLSRFDINVISLVQGTGSPGAATFNSSIGYQWTLLSAPTVSGFNASDFTLNTGSFTNGLGGGSFSLSGSATDIFLNFTPVPEPSTWALMAAGLSVLGFAGWRHRRALRA
jgi:hypothetical protein